MDGREKKCDMRQVGGGVSEGGGGGGGGIEAAVNTLSLEGTRDRSRSQRINRRTKFSTATSLFDCHVQGAGGKWSGGTRLHAHRRMSQPCSVTQSDLLNQLYCMKNHTRSSSPATLK